MTESFYAPEFKYTDRDVREDVSLRTIAETYIDHYGGEFEPLLNAKREFFSTGRLETRTARVVLNCMRYDPMVSHLLHEPRPQLALIRDTTMPKPFCNDSRPHYPHGETRGRKYYKCEGVPFPINRGDFCTRTVVKARYAAARNSSIYHKTSGKGKVYWRPPFHTMGPAKFEELIVDLICKYPSVLVDPMLFIEEPTDLLSTIKKKPGLRTLCRYCAEGIIK